MQMLERLYERQESMSTDRRKVRMEWISIVLVPTITGIIVWIGSYYSQQEKNKAFESAIRDLQQQVQTYARDERSRLLDEIKALQNKKP